MSAKVRSSSESHMPRAATRVRRVGVLRASALAFSSCITIGGASSGPRPTLAVINARVWTGVSARPWAEALAVDSEGHIAA